MKVLWIVAVFVLVQYISALPTQVAQTGESDTTDKEKLHDVAKTIVKNINPILQKFNENRDKDVSTTNKIVATMGTAIAAINGDVYYEIVNFEQSESNSKFFK
ncbi:uncharacterized protein LOC119659589 isoform X1 [Hermetia illucens]|uniref:uncharacterized protein LOC119659589 isoform X1 n=1 Tax=Hermetia illucens TaxID=343691 RepID=UPI0018CC3C8E|nr:uncharacterized protein LOC119659589 isoform X1 [Hermetia illucens]